MLQGGESHPAAFALNSKNRISQEVRFFAFGSLTFFCVLAFI
jgi:hypothetical protein